jgi:hypothetical protein
MTIQPYTRDSIERAKEAQYEARMAILRQFAVPQELIALWQIHGTQQLREWNALCATLVGESGR